MKYYKNILIVISLFLLVGCSTKMINECESDSDCVPERCCHPKACVPIEEASDCDKVACTLDYQEDDIVPSDCRCIEGVCN